MLEKKKNDAGVVKGWILPIAIGIIVALCVRQWVVSPARVPSASMYPTIPGVSSTDEAVILVNKLGTEFHPIHRGEVVVFHWPDNPRKLFVKRVIGMPGDTVKVTGNAVYINGKKLQELNKGIAKTNGSVVGTWKVPLGHYFMLGDNRPISDDSRMWVHKYVAKSAIVGEANLVLFPFGSFGPISQHV